MGKFCKQLFPVTRVHFIVNGKKWQVTVERINLASLYALLAVTCLRMFEIHREQVGKERVREREREIESVSLGEEATPISSIIGSPS